MPASRLPSHRAWMTAPCCGRRRCPPSLSSSLSVHIHPGQTAHRLSTSQPQEGRGENVVWKRVWERSGWVWGWEHRASNAGGQSEERQHPEQADLGGAFRTQGRNEPVVGSGNCSRKRKSDVFTGARWTMDFESQVESLDFSSCRFSRKQRLRVTCWSGPHRLD